MPFHRFTLGTPGPLPGAIARPVLLLLLAGGLLGLSSCGGSKPSASPTPAASSQPLVSQTPTAASPAGSSPAPAAAPGGTAAPTPAAPSATSPAAVATVPITVYKSDDQCVNFIPETVQVPGDRPLHAAVGKVLERQGDGYFDLSGYRVSVDAKTGEATVDLRMTPGSTRQIASLSACEQFALFGSLQETLTKNTGWNIKSVRFTERGQAIVF